MELICAWWNCRLSPPMNGATKHPMTEGFLSVFCELLRREIDILGLCEVSADDISIFEKVLLSKEFKDFEILNLYKGGNSIDDFCLIYNTKKLKLISVLEPANIRDPVFENWLKAGVFVQLCFLNSENLFVGLSHWQSRQTYSEGGPTRMKLGQALRAKVTEISETHPDAPIILLGDYNDEPYDESIVTGIGASRDAEFVRKRPKFFYNPYWGCLFEKDSSRPAGTYINKSIKSSGGVIFDQMMFSSHFLREWKFEHSGSIVSDLLDITPDTLWTKVSDHYPILSHLRRTSI
ncbi:endonuclease/exonuclease/phosphatase family protein [Pseudomonas syringae group genomosp. 7]|uniref:endonuclease/exonuclease/phosphatase family protein n=1 Tax=Pseudomonas syringae group genomosp. 7 TaxID=251699 RepID=UPI0011C46EF9|nr:endonuclease/exonuclease/phosphatase family protein [Pseudomonas syringae group genomosp. 7]